MMAQSLSDLQSGGGHVCLNRIFHGFTRNFYKYRLKKKVQTACYLTLKSDGGGVPRESRFVTTFACAFFTVIFSNCLTRGCASFDAKNKNK